MDFRRGHLTPPPQVLNCQTGQVGLKVLNTPKISQIVYLGVNYKFFENWVTGSTGFKIQTSLTIQNEKMVIAFTGSLNLN